MLVTDELQARGFIHQTTADNLATVLDGEPRVVYLGVDPTADSIHAGNFAVYMLLRHLAKAGHTIILLIGGGTGMIGDPKPDVERPLTDETEVAARAAALTAQVEQLLGQSVTVVNNHDWLASIPLITFLRDTGKHFTVNELLKKDAIATRVAGETGISYTEFAYPLLQAYDYLVLHERFGCSLQIGGSDQWGNIVAGVELVRRKTGHQVHALTIPLIIDKTTGKKFGKSEGNAVWLSAEKTTPYQFYQFWRSVADENVISYLKIFSLQSLGEIEDLAHAHEKNPGAQLAQIALAEAVTTLVHGAEVADSVAKVSAVLFGDAEIQTLTAEEIALVRTVAPLTEVASGTALVEVLVIAKLATSKREARTFIESGAIKINGQVITDVAHVLTSDNELSVIRRGKKQYCLVVCQ